MKQTKDEGGEKMTKMSDTAIDRAEKAIRALKEYRETVLHSVIHLEINEMIQRIKKEIKKQ